MTLRSFIRQNRKPIDLHMAFAFGPVRPYNDHQRRVFTLFDREVRKAAESLGVRFSRCCCPLLGVAKHRADLERLPVLVFWRRKPIPTRWVLRLDSEGRKEGEVLCAVVHPS